MVASKSGDFAERSGGTDFGSPFYTNTVLDNVSGISILEVEDSMKGSRSWNQLRDKIISKNPTQSTAITELFNNW